MYPLEDLRNKLEEVKGNLDFNYDCLTEAEQVNALRKDVSELVDALLKYFGRNSIK